MTAFLAGEFVAFKLDLLKQKKKNIVFIHKFNNNNNRKLFKL